MEFRKRNLVRPRRIPLLSRKLVLLFAVFVIASVSAYIAFATLNSDAVKAYQNYQDWSLDPNWTFDGYLENHSGWQATTTSDISGNNSKYKLWRKTPWTYDFSSDPLFYNDTNIRNLAPLSYYATNSNDLSNLENQNPFLLVGTYGGNPSHGFVRKELYIDFWIPDSEDLNNYVLDTYDLCHSSIDTGINASNERITVEIQSARNQKNRIRPIDLYGGSNATSRLCDSTNIKRSIELGVSLPPIAIKSLPDKQNIINNISNPGIKDYKKYTIVVKAVEASGSYYNFFRLRIRPKTGANYQTPSDQVDAYLTPATRRQGTAIETFHELYQDPDQASERHLGLNKDDNFGLPIGNTINNPFSTPRMLLYETSFLVSADPVVYECSQQQIKGYIGLYDTDRILENVGGLVGYIPYKSTIGIEIKADVFSASREDYREYRAEYLDGTRNFALEDTLTFNGKLDDNDNLPERTTIDDFEDVISDDPWAWTPLSFMRGINGNQAWVDARPPPGIVPGYTEYTNIYEFDYYTYESSNVYNHKFHIIYKGGTEWQWGYDNKEIVSTQDLWNSRTQISAIGLNVGGTGATDAFVDSSSNAWEDKLYSFQADKVYKIRFYNIDPRNFLQFRTPLEYINIPESCIKADIRIDNECKLYIKELFWENDPNVKLELQLQRKGTPPTLITQLPYESLVNTDPAVNRTIETWYDQVDPPANSQNSNNLIKELVSPSELLYSTILDAGLENYEFVLTGKYGTDPINDPTTIVNGIADGSIANQITIPILPDSSLGAGNLPRDHNDCLGYKAKIGARDCKIRWEELNITLPGGVRPDLHFEVLEGTTRVTQITYTNRGPDILGVRIEQPDLNSTLEITDLTDADPTWFNRAPGFTFKITGYYDDPNGTPGNLTDDVFRQFQTTDAHGNIVVIIPSIDTSDYYPNLPINNLSCIPKTTPCSVTPDIDVSNMVALTPLESQIRLLRNPGAERGDPATFDHGHLIYVQRRFWHDHDSDPLTPDDDYIAWVWEMDPDYHPNLPYIDEKVEIDEAELTHSGWRSPTESEMEGLIKKTLINGVDGTDTVTSLTGNSRVAKVGISLQNFRPGVYQTTGPYWELKIGNLKDIIFRNGDGASPIPGYGRTTYDFHIKSMKVTPAGEPTNVLDSHTGYLSGNFSLNDSRQFLRSTIQTYEWEMEWHLSISETLWYHWKWSNWDIEWNPHPSNLGYVDKWIPRGSTRTVSWEGQLNTCSRTMVVQMPECTVINLPTTILPRTKREKFDTDNNGTLETTIVHPVGKAEGRTVLKLVNPNVFGLRTTAANHPEYSITGDPFLSAPYYNGNPNLSNSTLDIISSVPPGGSKEYDEWPTAINLPGKYLITWTPRWQTDGRGYGVWDGREHVDTVCFGQNSTFIFIWADPPLCRVEYTIFEVGDSDTEIMVTLSNPNLAPMDIQSVQYTIDRNGSNPPNNRTGNALLPPHLNPILIGAKNTATGHVILKSTKQAISENGIYDFDWSINTSMGNERWTTLDFPQTPPQQNSWFENPNERITTTGPTGTIECKQKMRIAVRPYLKVFYGDVSAGGYFGLNEDYDACGDDNVIRTWTSTASGEPDGYIAAHGEGSNGGDAKGASVRHGIQAYDLVAGFYSSSQRNSLPQPLKGLTLNNVGLDDYDGGFGKPNCVGNYWREVSELPEEENLTNNNIEINLNSDLQDNDRRRYVLKDNQNLIIKSNNTSLGDLKATLFVEGQGNVYIENDIINNDAASWDDPSQIGYITIITRGNIYINPSVRKVDAVLVAYPKHYDDAVTGLTIAFGGEIWTCYFDGITAATHFNRCNNPLVVNGALIAQKVRLGRIYKSVKQATGTPEYDHNNSSSEMVNLLPEYLLGTPELPIFPDQIYKSDSISVHPVNF